MVIHKKFLNTNLFLIKTFLITKFDCIFWYFDFCQCRRNALWSNLVNKTENASKSSRDIWEHLQNPLCFDMPNLIGTLSTIYLLQQILKKATFGIWQFYIRQRIILELPHVVPTAFSSWKQPVFLISLSDIYEFLCLSFSQKIPTGKIEKEEDKR